MNGRRDTRQKPFPQAEKRSLRPRVAMYLVPPRGGHWKYTKNLLTEIKTCCLLVSSRDINFQQHITQPSLFWSKGPHQSLLSKGRLIFSYIQNIYRLIKAANQFDIQVLHFQSFEPISIGLFFPYLTRKYQLVISVHNVLPHSYYSPLTSKIEKYLRGHIFRQADHLFVFSRYGERKLISEFAVDPERVETLPMGCHEPVPEKSSLAGHQLSDQPTFLIFGGYRPNKGFEILVDAFIQARQEGLPGRLWVAGKYPRTIQSMTEEKFHQTGLQDSVQFTNRFIPEDEIDPIFRKTDFVVIPYTRFESQSGVIFLAYAYDLPILASRVGGLTEVIQEDQSGIIFDPGNVNDLKNALFAGIESWDELTKVDRPGLLREKYAWELIADKTDQYYRGILKDL